MNNTLPYINTDNDFKLELNKNFLKEKNISYIITRINLDSRYRIQNPKQVISKYINTIQYIEFTINSPIITIYLSSINDLSIDDTITLSGIESSINVLLPGSIQLKKNSSYLYINQKNHGYINNNNIINISGIINSTSNNYFLGNIPLSIINKQFNVQIINTNGIIDNDNYIVDLGIISNYNYIYTETGVTIELLTINGININYLNASYPITNNVLQGYFTIINSNSNSIQIQLNVSASSTGIYKNNKIIIGVISKNSSSYPNPDFVNYELNKNYNNIKKIKLISIELPISDILIRDLPLNLKNNNLYFQIIDDGDYIYKISINSGNYTASSLQIELTNQLNNIKRNFGIYINSNLYNKNIISNIILNEETGLFSLQILSLITLSQNIIISNIQYDDLYNRINITHSYHNLNIGDKILISGAINIIDSTINNNTLLIPNNIINTYHIIESIIDINNYTIKLPKYNPEIILTNQIYGNIYGGNAVLIQYPLQIRLLFNYNDTFGDILGFKYIGETTSITNFSSTITNRLLYYNDSNLNSVGLINNTIPTLKFIKYSYILMITSIIRYNINEINANGVFAKIFLNKNYGCTIYNQFCQLSENIHDSIHNLNEIDFQFLTPDGKNYTFNNQDYSCTLELYQELEC